MERTIRCVAIDDEPLALEVIEKFCARIGGIEIKMFADSEKGLACVLEEEPDISDRDADKDLRVRDGSIDFDHVYFKDNSDSEEWNIRDVDLYIKSGSTVGIIGATGSAKSTLVQLIPRLYEAGAGTVRVGGRPVQDYTMEHLRDAVYMVLQKNR